MARPQKNTVDYFPFICEDGNKMFYIEETYGNDGFATFIKLLRELAKTNFHYLDLSKPTTMMFLSAKCKVSKEVLEAIINDLVMLEKFNATLWNENKIIWCQDFIDSIQDAYIKRNNKCITFEGLCELLTSLGVRKLSKCKSKVPDNTQSILEYTKEEKTKEKETKENDILFEKETKKDIKFSFEKGLLNYGFDSDLVKDWLLVRKTKKATNTETAFKGFIKEIEKREFNLNKILEFIITKNWSGFKWSWYDTEIEREKSSAKKENEIVAGRQTMETIKQNLDTTGLYVPQ